MLIAVGNEHLTSHDLPLTSHDFFIFGPFLFFLLKISLLEMLIAVGNEHLKIMYVYR